jgi:iron complex outermembrane receptor protein
MRKENVRQRLFATVASCGLVGCFVNTAFAEDSSVAASDGQENKLDEIVVTAERRAERMQDVPLTVQSVSAATLANEGITTTRDLTAAFPGIVFAERGSFSQPVIRGVSSQGTGALVDPAIGLYVDGVYQPNPMANLYDLSDIDRIEVLKGPQGTLYGRNATGGAINIVTLQPQRSPTMDASVGYGSLNETTGSIYAMGIRGTFSLDRHSVTSALQVYVQSFCGHRCKVPSFFLPASECMTTMRVLT